MKMKTILGSENYQAKVFEIKEYKKHPQADKLWIVIVDFQNVITGVEPIIGQKMVYFPVLSRLNPEFISTINGFRHSELNQDIEKIGFFEDNCKVRPIKLRGIPSVGYMHPVEDIEKFLNVKLKEGDEFNSVGDIILCEKFVVKPQKIKDSRKKAVKKSLIVDNQFVQHINTQNLRRNMSNITPGDIISITYKVHGTSGITGNLLVKKKLNWFKKLLKFQNSKYDIVNSSRRVIKSIGSKNISKESYYDTEIWSITGQEMKEKIPEGYTLYYEIVGQLPSGKWIQKNYDYGNPPKQHSIYIYRITHTTPSGFRIELSESQIIDFCNNFNIQCKPFLFLGKAKDLFSVLNEKHKVELNPDVTNQQEWEENFLKLLELEYTEKDCYLCMNKVPEEGIVFRKENTFSFDAWKLKSYRFLENESKEQENNEINIEDEQ